MLRADAVHTMILLSAKIRVMICPLLKYPHINHSEIQDQVVCLYVTLRVNRNICIINY